MAPYLRDRYRVEESAWIRGNILIGLSQLGFEEDKTLFVEAIENPDNFVSTSALLAMAMRDDEDAQEKLKGFLDAEELPVRIAAAWGRGIIEDEKAREILLSIADKEAGLNARIKNIMPDLPGDEQSIGGGWGNYLPRAMAGEALLYLAGRNP